jgi:hypothetical protein
MPFSNIRRPKPLLDVSSGDKPKRDDADGPGKEIALEREPALAGRCIELSLNAH